MSDHFEGKSAVQHVAEAQAKGMIAATEVHGFETPGSISAAMESIKSVTVISVAVTLFLLFLQQSVHNIFLANLYFCFVITVWVTARSALLGWSRLERLHRVLEQEKWEIDHNRDQEREELKALYQAKGFEGQLLEEVMDVLMADGDRLLKVMVEEELGLSLEKEEHPLKQALGAFTGATTATILLSLAFNFFDIFGLIAAAALNFIFSSYVSAKYLDNEKLPTIIWNLASAFLAVSTGYFFLQFIYKL